MIDKVKEFVKNKMDHESTGHDYEHALRVFENAKRLMDNELVKVSALVHDLIDSKVTDDVDKEKKELIEFLQTIYDDSFVKQVFEIIENMSYRTGRVPESIEGKIVQDADRLDSLGAVGIARTFAFGGKHNRNIYKPGTNDSVSHFYDKLLKLEGLMNTEEGRIEAKRRTKYMKEFLKEFYKEVSESSQDLHNL
jgi:uncharacterized protein